MLGSSARGVGGNKGSSELGKREGGKQTREPSQKAVGGGEFGAGEPKGSSRVGDSRPIISGAVAPQVLQHQEGYSLRGIERGIKRLRVLKAGVPVVVVGEDPSWLWACEQMGLLPVLWLGASAASESATRQFFPELRYGGSDPACLSEGIGQKVRAVMVSGSLSGDHLWALQLPGVEWIFSAGKPIRGRMFLKYWQQMESLKLGHSERGGVTDGHYQLQAFRRRGEEARADARQDIKLPTRKPRDLLTVVYDCVETGKDWIKPVTPHVQKPTVRPVPGMRDVFQGGGLLPVRSSRFTRFIVPGVRSRTGWVIRPLTGVEQLQARDVPTRIAEAMNKESDTRAQCWEQLTPAKCLVDGASFILQKHNCATWLTGALVQGVDIPFVAPVVPVTEAEAPKVENGTPGRSHLGLGPQLQREETEEADQEARNLKAVKADDAEVPVELWNARIRGRLHPGGLGGNWPLKPMLPPTVRTTTAGTRCFAKRRSNQTHTARNEAGQILA